MVINLVASVTKNRWKHTLEPVRLQLVSFSMMLCVIKAPQLKILLLVNVL